MVADGARRPHPEAGQGGRYLCAQYIDGAVENGHAMVGAALLTGESTHYLSYEIPWSELQTWQADG
eukprot:3652872-Amphidinium_carterae.1